MSKTTCCDNSLLVLGCKTKAAAMVEDNGPSHQAPGDRGRLLLMVTASWPLAPVYQYGVMATRYPWLQGPRRQHRCSQWSSTGEQDSHSQTPFACKLNRSLTPWSTRHVHLEDQLIEPDVRDKPRCRRVVTRQLCPSRFKSNVRQVRGKCSARCTRRGRDPVPLLTAQVGGGLSRSRVDP